jgi:peptidoglycan/xylan/chitin deacetylase (PgdA/CDA1 family)
MDKFLWWGFYFFTFYAFLPALVSRMFGFRAFRKGLAEREIALTFDDGPDPVYTPQLLDLLKRHGAKATFFVVGAHAERHPELIRRMHEEGHVIGIHNYVHLPNWILRPRAVKRQVQRTRDIIASITGEAPKYYRPPWGIVNVFDYAVTGKLQIVLWTSMFGDWRRKVGPERLYARMRKKLRPGQVFLLHDRGDTFGADEEAPANMLRALERLMDDAAALGYRFVNMEEMIALTEANKKRRASRQEDGKHGDPLAGVSFGKRLLVSLWMVWEKLYHLIFRLRPLGDGSSFHYRITRYPGRDLSLANGDVLRRGDRVIELHFDNRMLFRLSAAARSEIHTALRLIRVGEQMLPQLAAEYERLPDRETIRGVYGITLIYKGTEALGFHVFELSRGWTRRLIGGYLHLLIAVFRSGGARRTERFPLEPKIVFLSSEELMKWKNGPVRSARRAQQKQTGSGPSADPDPAEKEPASL